MHTMHTIPILGGLLAAAAVAMTSPLGSRATGAAAGTLFRSARDAGLDLPSATSGGNMSANFFKQFGPLLPTNLYFAAVPYYEKDDVSVANEEHTFSWEVDGVSPEFPTLLSRAPYVTAR